jgi:hypothetical protein
VVHCPYCHGWEVRDESIAVLARGPASTRHALQFRQLSDDIVYPADGTDLDDDTRDRFAACGVRVIDAPVSGIESASGAITGVRLIREACRCAEISSNAHCLRGRVLRQPSTRSPGHGFLGTMPGEGQGLRSVLLCHSSLGPTSAAATPYVYRRDSAT